MHSNFNNFLKNEIMIYQKMKKFKIMGIVLISLLFVGVVNAETTTCESTNTKSCVANATDLKTALDAGKSVLLTSDRRESDFASFCRVLPSCSLTKRPGRFPVFRVP